MTLLVSILIGAGMLLVSSGLDGTSLTVTFQKIMAGGTGLDLSGSTIAPTLSGSVAGVPVSVGTGTGQGTPTPVSGATTGATPVTQPTGGSSKPYTYNQLVVLAQEGGWSAAQSRIAAAIALAESGGDPLSYNPETAAAGGTPKGEGSYGLWQVYSKVHPELAKKYNLYDPLQNAEAAHAVFVNAGNSWTPWTTYGNGNGTYRQFLPTG